MSINSRKLAQELDKTSACFFIICTNKKRLSQINFEMAFFVSAKKIGQVLTSLSQNLPVSLIFCILGNQVRYPKDNV